MKKISKIIIILVFTLVSFLTFYGCKLSKYKVTFNNEHIKYLSEKAYSSNKVPYGKEAHFEIIVPDGKEIKTVKVNNTELNKKVISNNRFTLYNITENKNIQVEFQDPISNLVLVELSGGVTFADKTTSKELALGTSHKLEIPYYTLVSDNNAVEKVLASLKVNEKDVYRQVETKLNVVEIGGKMYSNGTYTLIVSPELIGENNKITVTANLLEPVYKNIILPAGVSEDYDNKTSNFLVGLTYCFRVSVPSGQEIDEVKVNDTKIKHNLNDNTFYYQVENKDGLAFTVTYKPFVQKYRVDLPAEITFKDSVVDNICEQDKVYKLIIKPSDGKQVKELKVDKYDYISQFYTEGDHIVFDLKVTAAHKVTVSFEDKKANNEYKITFGSDTQKYVEFFDGVKGNQLYTAGKKVVFKLKEERPNTIFISLTANSFPLEKQADGNYFFYLNRNVSITYNSKPYASITFDKDTLDKITLKGTTADLFTELGPDKLKFNIKNGSKIEFELKNVPEGHEIDLLASTPKITFNGTYYEFTHDKENQTFKVVFCRKTFSITANAKFVPVNEFTGAQSIDGLVIDKVEYGTVIKFKVSNANYKVVTLDGTAITPNGDGIYEFTVTKHHNLVFSE